MVSFFIIDVYVSLLGIGFEKDKEMIMVMGISICYFMLNEK